MDNERQAQKDDPLPEKTYEFLSLVKKNQDITVRDDQFDFSTLLDAIRLFRDGRHRFRLVDTGRFDSFELEWLTSNGADLYTSDEVRSNAQELEFINTASKRGKALVAYFYKGILDTEEREASLLFSHLMNAGRSGIFIHVSNKRSKQDISQIAQLAYNCAKGGSWLVYYHHGPLDSSLVDLGRNGAWIHVFDQNLEGEESQSIIKDVVLSARSSGANLVFHWDKGVNFSLLEDIVKAGAVVLFKSALFDYKSPFKVLEKAVRGRRLDFRAYYLYPTVVP